MMSQLGVPNTGLNHGATDSSAVGNASASQSERDQLVALLTRLSGSVIDSATAKRLVDQLNQQGGGMAIQAVHSLLNQLGVDSGGSQAVRSLAVASNPLGAIFLRLMAIGHAMATETRTLFMNTVNLRKEKAEEAAYEQFKGAIGQFVLSMASAALSLGMAGAYTRGVAREGTLDAKGVAAKGPSPWLGPMGAQLFAPTFTSTGQFIYEYQQLQSTLDTIDKEYLDRQLDLVQDLIKRQETMGTR